jgi:hypothetical protein
MTLRTIVGSTTLALALVVGAGTARAQDAQTCQPGLTTAFAAHAAQYQTLINALVPNVGPLVTGLATLSEAGYPGLLAAAETTADAAGATGRVVLTLPDGTVVVDTSRATNTWANFQAKTINENHNSRLAILAAQEYPCGIAIESKVSTSTGVNEGYVALRAGSHLDSWGTIRISSQQ